MNAFKIFRIGLLLVMLTSVARAEITTESLLAEMVDYDSVARWPSPSFTMKQASSYDRGSKSPDQPGWFANRDFSSYIRTEQHAGRTEQVMLDVDGPGAIVRFWLTSPNPNRAYIRLYLDHASEPTIEWPTYNLTSSPQLKLDPPLLALHPAMPERGGSTLYLPIPYAKHCRVTVELTDPQESRYYQIDYRTYPPGTAVKTFTASDLGRLKEAVDRTNRTLAAPPERIPDMPMAGGPVQPGRDADGTYTKEATLAAGESVTLDLPEGSMAVQRLTLKVGADLPAIEREAAFRHVVLRGSFDEQVDAIWSPVCDFAGSGAGAHLLKGWYRTVPSPGTSVCRWTMPYRQRASLTLQNLHAGPVKVSIAAIVLPWRWDDRSMYFHATWKQTRNIATDPPSDIDYLTVKGRGVVVGDVTAVFNPADAWYGEGDEKIWVEGETFPSTIGTGTEDYYNASWAPNPLFQTPFASQPRADRPSGQGQNCYTRTRNLDGIPFEKSLKFAFEIQSWKPASADWTSCVYWYGFAGATAEQKPQPEEAAAAVRTLNSQ